MSARRHSQIHAPGTAGTHGHTDARAGHVSTGTDTPADTYDTWTWKMDTHAGAHATVATIATIATITYP